jgi:rare lipoprotein A
MRSFFLSAAVVCVVGAGAAAPAAADVFDDRLVQISRDRQSGVYSERSERPRISREENSGRRRLRIARATINDEEDYDSASRRRVDRSDVDEDGDYVRRRSTRHRSREDYSRRAAPRRHVARLHRSHHHASAPRWTRRSLSSAGPRGSGQLGVASYYWEPQRLASGGWFNPNALTAAHRTLPFGTRVRVTHARSGRSVDVTINDRGPYVAGRVIDLSRAAARAIGMTAQGLAQVKVMILGR